MSVFIIHLSLSLIQITLGADGFGLGRYYILYIPVFYIPLNLSIDLEQTESLLLSL